MPNNPDTDKLERLLVKDCRKGSCHRHGRCMYLNAPWCPRASLSEKQP
jgi:hypothetical protein